MYSLLLRTILTSLFLRSSLAQTCNTCRSFGVDFKHQGSYFQNSLSTDPFTAVQEFEGCTNDTSHNVLVDPKGKQYECSMTPMSSDDTPEQLTCPINKNQMYTGEWSLLILSNNGDCAPIDYERDFYLSVGPQQTTTVSPTVSITTTITPIENSTSLQSETITSTAAPSTTTLPLVTLTPTITIRPLPVITKVTKAIFTISKMRLEPTVVATSTAMRKAKCHLPRKQQTADPVASIVATVLGDLDSILTGLVGRDALPEPTAGPDSANLKGGEDVEAFVQARKERMGLQKRAPDVPTLTVTDASASPVVSTITTTAATQTIVITSTTYLTTTYTPVVTVRRGVDITISTVTAPQRTLTKTIWTVATTTRTKTQSVTLTITSTSTPSAAAKKCSRIGGTMY